MVRRSTLYDLSRFGWVALVAGGTVALYVGAAEPYVSLSGLPVDAAFAFAGSVALAVVGERAIAAKKQRAWLAAGRRANLSTAGGRGLFGTPELTGTIHGRPVRARTVSRATGSTSQGNTQTETFTVVEADLDRPAEVGLLVCPTDGVVRQSGRSAGITIDPANADVSDDDFAVIGGPEAVARELLSGRSRAALVDLGDFDLLFVGNASRAIEESLPDASDSRLQSWLQNKAVDATAVPGDVSTVAIDTKGLVLDADRLRRQAAAVAAVADAFEHATASA